MMDILVNKKEVDIQNAGKSLQKLIISFLTRKNVLYLIITKAKYLKTNLIEIIN